MSASQILRLSLRKADLTKSALSNNKQIIKLVQIYCQCTKFITPATVLSPRPRLRENGIKSNVLFILFLGNCNEKM